MKAVLVFLFLVLSSALVLTQVEDLSLDEGSDASAVEADAGPSLDDVRIFVDVLDLDGEGDAEPVAGLVADDAQPDAEPTVVTLESKIGLSWKA